MSHNYTPGMKCRILSFRIAVPAEMEEDEIADYFSAMLSGAIADDHPKPPVVIDWGYIEPPEKSPIVVLSANPEEGEAVTNPSLSCCYCGGHDLVTVDEWDATSRETGEHITLTRKGCEDCPDDLEFWIDEGFYPMKDERHLTNINGDAP